MQRLTPLRSFARHTGPAPPSTAAPAHRPRKRLSIPVAVPPSNRDPSSCGIKFSGPRPSPSASLPATGKGVPGKVSGLVSPLPVVGRGAEGEGRGYTLGRREPNGLGSIRRRLRQRKRARVIPRPLLSNPLSRRPPLRPSPPSRLYFLYLNTARGWYLSGVTRRGCDGARHRRPQCKQTAF